MSAARRPRSEAGPPQRLPRGERRRRIVAVARRLFAQCGYAETSWERIASEAALSPSQLSRTFASKADLLEAVGEEWLATLFPVADSATPPDPETHLSEWTAAFFRTIQADADVFPILLRVSATPSDPAAMLACQRLWGQWVERLVPLIRGGQQAGVYRRSLDARREAEEWLRALLGYCIMNGFQPPPEPDPVQDDSAFETLLHGLLKTDI